jgi:hypothetical protein
MRTVAALLGLSAITSSAAADPSTPAPPRPAPSDPIPRQVSSQPAAPAPPDAAQPGTPTGQVPRGGSPIEHEVTAAEVATAPVPGHESGRVDGGDGGDGAARMIARGILFVPRIVFEVVDAPLRGAIWLNQRYQVSDLYYRVFFNDKRTFGIVPTGSFDTGFGWTAGARLITRDLFGEGEGFRIGGAAGEGFRSNASASLRSGQRFGKQFELGLEGSFERHPNDLFYGLGNGDLGTPPMTLIDPRTDDTAVRTRYRMEMERVALVGDVRPVDKLHLRATAALTDLDLGVSTRNGEDPPIDQVYVPEGLVGFADVKHAYGELEVRWDGRGRASNWDSRQVYSDGGLVAAFVGLAHRVDPGRDFTRYGFELQYFLRLADGPRVIATRFHAEAVSGDRDDVPLIELPRLGGAELLRGYDLDRFRDRVAAVGSAEYGWDLSHMLDASLFVDAGRVFPGLGSVTVDHLRCGFGGALSLHGDSYFILQASLATSIDGGIFFNLGFNRSFDSSRRWR